MTTAAIELLLYTGCRLSEVLNLEWSRVDLTESLITLRETKAGRPQFVVVSAPARRVLDELTPGLNSTARWVLPSRDDTERPLSKTAIEQAWQRLRHVAKLDDVHLHDLRHTLGTYAGQTGANAFLVRDLLRHRTLAMTGRYVNRANDPIRTAHSEGRHTETLIAYCTSHVCATSRFWLFDHSVDTNENRFRSIQAECFGCLGIDNEIELASTTLMMSGRPPCLSRPSAQRLRQCRPKKREF